MPMMKLVARCVLALLVLGMFSRPATAQRADAFTQETQQRVDEILSAAGGDAGSVDGAYSELSRLADYVSAHAGPRQHGAMVSTEGALGALELIMKAGVDDPAAATKELAAHPAFRNELGLLWMTGDRAGEVVRIARELVSERPQMVDRFPALAAAVSVVHDLPGDEALSRRVNENTGEGEGPLEVFDFFADNAGSMTISPDRLPAIALVHVVDVSQPVEQLRWAHNSFARSPGIEQRFKEIVYDDLHFQLGRAKRVTTAAGPYTLQKIKQHGGVCADQAYYAEHVAKACGVPSVYVVAKGADVSHAWVGFVEARGRRMDWNFDAGRYDAYQKLRGNIVDPQTGKRVSDGMVGILGSAMGAPNDEVLATRAAARAVNRMNQRAWQPGDDIELDGRGNVRSARTGSVEDQLALLRAVLTDNAGSPAAWNMVREIATMSGMTEAQMDTWTRAVMQLAGRQHQDFAYDFLVDMISTVEDAQRQHDMWEWAFNQFRARPDLAAGIRFRQGELWSQNNNQEYAWLAYKDVADRFINEGPMVVDALSSMGEMLDRAGKRDQLVPVLEDAARRVRRPGEMGTQFATQSNFYKINSMLADEYERMGRTQQASQLRQQLDVKE